MTPINCKTKKDAEHALKTDQDYYAKVVELTFHQKKMKLVSMWDGKGEFDFLGMHHRRPVVETGKGQKYNKSTSVSGQESYEEDEGTY